MNNMKVLSLFDGIGGARQALKELNIDCEYYASEIDPYAIQIAKDNHPDIESVGDVKDIEYENGVLYFNKLHMEAYIKWFKTVEIDLLIGGSPCQNLSIAGNGEGLKGEKSSLFYEYVRILKEIKPKYFLFENVASMSKENQNLISEELGVEPIMINSNLVTAQNRKRLYFTNIPNIEQPHDKGVKLKDILQDLKNCHILNND